LPHRNPAFPEMWPYNIAPDAYLASHTCCSTGSEYTITITVNELTDGYYLIHNEFGADYAVEVLETSNVFIDLTDDGMLNVSFPSIVGLTDLTIIVSTTDPLAYPAWGAWMPDTTVCHGGVPKVGAIQKFAVEDIAHDYPEVGETSSEYHILGEVHFDNPLTGRFDVPKRMYNDIWVSNFERRCSGDRGNICSGDAFQIFRLLSQCEPDMNYDDLNQPEDRGEIESCRGPPETITSPKPIPSRGTACFADTDCGNNGICIIDKCYTRPPESCVGYDRTTFEETFGLNRTDFPNQAANGTCNPWPACSPNEVSYDTSLLTGQFYVPAATCGLGTCSRALDAFNCEEFNGWSDMNMNRPFCNILDLDDGFFTSQFICTAEDEPVQIREVKCDIGSGTTDPDDEQEYCEACKFQNPAPNGGHMDGAWTGSKCCGDDLGEGGFGYSKTFGSLVIPRAFSATDLDDAGDYRVELCDDFVDANGNSEFDTGEVGIDNDCRAGTNCGDTFCIAPNYQTARLTETWEQYIGPRKSICCGIRQNCKDFLDPDATNNQGVLCTDDECDCVAVDGVTNVNHGSATVGGTVKTCIPPLSELPNDFSTSYDRKFLVSGASDCTVVEKDIDGGNNCEGDVDCIISSDSIHFRNRAGEDCLVEVTIT
ncbi:hypothetical protein KY349_03565, partial [Candidatus Woesearchaeota archaeon]|nr:hypothetical protein [Candidatus Woesearchaeota archaeon]